jgi:leucyl-tRNA synthetase
MKSYNHKSIESKWQKEWDKKKSFKALTGSKKKKFYSLMEFPYPSGDGLHTGHVKGYTAMDIISRKRRLEGFNVVFPIGFDAFGLPTENYAIKTGKQPSVITKKNTDNFRKQFKSLGMSFDWDREINTTDPKYYKWTQWIFLKFLEKGLAYKSKMTINWCPKDRIGLANEEVINGCCERCGTAVEKREKEQWMLAITKYADRLCDDLDLVDYLPQIKLQQRNWIGRSEGINITYKIANTEKTITVFTTRPDTNFGATFIAIAPDGNFIKDNSFLFKNKKEIDDYVQKSVNKTDIDRLAEGRKKTGVFTGLYAINFLNNKKIPIYVADFVLGGVGTGALVGVPGHDLRDFDFAKEMNLEIIRVVVGNDGDSSLITRPEQVQEENGVMINSGFLDGLEIHKATEKIMNYIEENGYGKRVVTYKLRDWVFSRQRYWGEPIPVIHCQKCGVVPVPEKDLPVMLPKVKNYQPTENGESPLANIKKWVEVKCPKCKSDAKRETDTMPNWAGSSWYYLRYMDPKNNKNFADQKSLKYWNQVDWYNGGMEHTTLHLLYSRFWHKFLYDLKLVPTKEPYKKRTSHGMILAKGGEKMSKSKGNVINPDEIVKTYGADTLRVYEMFMGPFDQASEWDTNSIIGCRRFVERVWRLKEKCKNKKSKLKNTSQNPKIESLINKTIKKVSENIESMKFNTAISSLMICLNEMEKEEEILKSDFEKFILLLSPFAPHITSELWQILGNKKDIVLSAWPKYDPNKIQEDEVKIGVQINGKVRGDITVSVEEDESTAIEKAKQNPDISKWIEGKEIKKVIYIKGKILNILI